MKSLRNSVLSFIFSTFPNWLEKQPQYQRVCVYTVLPSPVQFSLSFLFIIQFSKSSSYGIWRWLGYIKRKIIEKYVSARRCNSVSSKLFSFVTIIVAADNSSSQNWDDFVHIENSVYRRIFRCVANFFSLFFCSFLRRVTILVLF